MTVQIRWELFPAFLDAIASLLSTQAGHFLCKRKDNGDKDGSSTLINKRYNIMRDDVD